MSDIILKKPNFNANIKNVYELKRKVMLST